MKEATLEGLLQADAKSLYREFNDTLQLIKETTDPKVKSMWIDDLTALWSRAKQLLDTELLNHQTLPMMKLITSRPSDQWVVLAKNGNSQIIPSFRN
jgi:hypothetical protein